MVYSKCMSGRILVLSNFKEHLNKRLRYRLRLNLDTCYAQQILQQAQNQHFISLFILKKFICAELLTYFRSCQLRVACLETKLVATIENIVPWKYTSCFHLKCLNMLKESRVRRSCIFQFIFHVFSFMEEKIGCFLHNKI